MIDLATVGLLAAQSLPAVSAGTWNSEPNSPICAMAQETSSQTIKVSRTPANDETQLEVSVPKRLVTRAGKFRGSIHLTPAGESPAEGFFTKKGRKLVVYAQTPDPAFIQNLANATGLAISNGADDPVPVTFSSAGNAVDALRGCEDRKMAAWGIDPIAWRSLKSRPFPLSPARDGFSALNYPEEALRAHIEFDAIIRLDIGIDGRVESCRGLNPGSYKGFETASCEVLKRAQFRPALDAAGKPVSAPVVFDVVFRIES